MNSIACQNALMDLFRGKLTDDEEVKFTSTIKEEGISPAISTTEVITGGAPAADAIKDIFNPAEVEMGEINEVENPDKLHSIVGGNDDEVPDEDAFEPIEKDGDGILITEQTIEQPNNDYEEAEEEIPEVVTKDGDPILITGGASTPIQRVAVITADLKFPWILKQKHRID